MESPAIYEALNKILFSDLQAPSDDEPASRPQTVPERYRTNYLFCRFHHLFDYESTYYTYLVAKLTSRKLFRQDKVSSTSVLGSRANTVLSVEERDLIFERPGEHRGRLKSLLI